jgi:hypothetical protein
MGVEGDLDGGVAQVAAPPCLPICYQKTCVFYHQIY